MITAETKNITYNVVRNLATFAKGVWIVAVDDGKP